MATTLGTLLIDIKGDTTQLINGFNRAESAVNKTTKQMTTAIKTLAGAYVSLEGVDLAKSYAKQVDILTNVNNRLKLVTKSTQELSVAQNEIYRISQLTSTSYSNTADLFSRVALSTKELNLSQKDLLGITETINKSMILSGGTAESMNAAIIQLGQAFQADFKAVGQELSSIREQTPRLYQAIVEGSGYSSAAFKKAAEDGKISSQIIINALKSQVDAINSEYGKFTKTIEQAMVNATNATQKFIGEFDKVTGISSKVSSSILSISDSLDNLSTEEIQSLIRYFENAGIAILGSVVALKAGKIAYEVYSASLAKTNAINKLNIDIENSKAKAYSDGMKAVYARKIADEALNTGMLNGINLSKSKINQLQKEALSLENVAKKQVAFSYSLESSAKGFNLATTGANLLRGALSTIPFVALSVGFTMLITKLLETSKREQDLTDVLNTSNEDLKKKTTSQLKYALALVESETATLRLARANAIAGAASQDLFQSDASFQEEKSRRDEIIAKFDENIAKSKELKALLSEKTNIKEQVISTKVNFDSSSIDKAVKEILNPYQAKLDEINKKWDDQKNVLIKNSKDTSEVEKARAKEIADLDKEYADKKTKENEKYNKSVQKSLEDTQSQYANYYEKIKDYSNLWAIEEQRLRKDNTNLTAEQLNKLLEIEKANFNERFNLSKSLLSADDWKEYYAKIGEYEYAWQIELSENFDKWKALAGEKLPELVEIYKKEFYEKIQPKEIKPFEFDIDLDGFDNSITNVLKSFDKLNEATLEYNKYIKQSGLTKEEIAKADEKNFSNQLKGYSNIAGAISELSGINERAMATIKAAQTALALVEGTRAILTAGTGDPYTAIPRMIAMGAMVSSLLGNIGIAFGMNKSSETQSGIGLIAENTGTGTVAGDATKASESITKSLSVLEDFAQPQFRVLSEMNKNVKTIADSIDGVARILVNNSGFALGEGFVDSSSTKQAISLNGFMQDMIMPLEKIISKIPIIGNLGILGGNLGGIGGLINKALGSVFGKTSVKTKLVDAGYVFADTLLTTAIDEGISNRAYQYVKIKKTKKSLFGSSSSTKYKTYYGQGLDAETSNQFSLILGNIYDTVLSAGTALDSTVEQTTQSLSKYVVSLGKLSLKGKNQEQIQELLSNIFSAQADKIAKTAFPLLDTFQQVGEGMFETLTRVATGMEEAGYYASRLGKSFEDIKYTDIVNTQGDVGFEALYQIIAKTEEALYPVNNGLLDIISNLDTTTEELYTTYTALDELRDRIIFLGQNSQGLTSSMIYGAGSISELQDGFKDFFDNFLTDSEQLGFNTSQLIKSFEALGIAVPASKDDFRLLLNSIDLTSESGQELYGRLITLSGSFSDVYDEVENLNSVLIETFTSLKDIAKDFINSFNTSDISNTRSQILAYNELRSQFESLFGVQGQLLDTSTTGQENARTIYTQLASLGKTLGNNESSLISSLVSQFEQDLSIFDFQTEVMKVSIVDGLSKLETLSQQQLNTLTSEQIANLGTISGSVTAGSVTTSNYDLANFSILESIKSLMSDLVTNISDYPKRTYDIIDDVINGNLTMKVEMA